MGSGEVSSVGIYGEIPKLGGDVKLEAGTNIALSYDFAHNSIVISKLGAPKLFPGLIGSKVLDSWIDGVTVFAYVPMLRRLGNVVILCRSSATGKMSISTFDILPNGAISDAPLDSWDYASVGAGPLDIGAVLGDVHVIGYTDNSYNGKLMTVAVGSEGTITKSAIDSKTYGANVFGVSMCAVPGTNFWALSYRNRANNRVTLQTRYIGTDGTIGGVVQGSLEIADTCNGYAYIKRMKGNVYALVYQRMSTSGFRVATVSISGAGAISGPIDTWDFDTGYNWFPGFKKISDNVIVVGVQTSSTKMAISTIRINDDGTIEKAFVGRLANVATRGGTISCSHIGENVWAFGYTETLGYARVSTLLIGADGTFDPVFVSSYNFGPGTWERGDLLSHHPNLLTASYNATGVSTRLYTMYVDP